MNNCRAVALRAVAAAFTVGVVTVACSDGTSRLSASEYRSRASAECDTLEEASTELAKAQAPSATGNTVTRYVHRAADRLRDLVDSLDALEPPRALEHDAGDLVHLLDRYADGLDELARHVEPDDTLTSVFGKNTQLVERLNGVAGDATALVTKLELTGCLLT